MTNPTYPATSESPDEPYRDPYYTLPRTPRARRDGGFPTWTAPSMVPPTAPPTMPPAPPTAEGVAPTTGVPLSSPPSRAEPGSLTADLRRRTINTSSRARQVLMYPVLLVMAGADAYGFWNTLTKVIQRDTALVLVFVSALALGSVAVAHEVGRLLRSRIEGFGGSVLWMTVLSVMWLSLGTAIAWLRAHDSTGPVPDGSGELADAATGIDSGMSATSIELAALLLGLYLLTGALAMSHAYRFGDPRSAEIRRAHQRRKELAAKLAEQQYRLHLAEGQLKVRQADREREAEQRASEQELNEAWEGQLRSEARQETARHQHDPAATDALTRKPEEK